MGGKSIGVRGEERGELQAEKWRKRGGKKGRDEQLTLHRPAECAGPIRPADILKLRARGKVLPVLGLEIQVLVIARVGLNVHAVFAKVEVFNKRVVAVARALEAVRLPAVNVNLVVH